MRGFEIERFFLLLLPRKGRHQPAATRIHTSLEPGLGAPGAAEAAAAATLAKYSASSSGGNGELRQGHEAAWAEEWEGGIEARARKPPPAAAHAQRR